MNMLIYLIPIALMMGGIGLLAFVWSLKSGQYDDLEGAAWRILVDEEPIAKKHESQTGQNERKIDACEKPRTLAV